jgi:hypothetical protein
MSLSSLPLYLFTRYQKQCEGSDNTNLPYCSQREKHCVAKVLLQSWQSLTVVLIIIAMMKRQPLKSLLVPLYMEAVSKNAQICLAWPMDSSKSTDYHVLISWRWCEIRNVLLGLVSRIAMVALMAVEDRTPQEIWGVVSYIIGWVGLHS